MPQARLFSHRRSSICMAQWAKSIEFFPEQFDQARRIDARAVLSFWRKNSGWHRSGGPIFDKEGAYVHGVVSKGWENEAWPENFSFGSMLRPSMGIPIAKMGGKSLEEMQRVRRKG